MTGNGSWISKWLIRAAWSDRLFQPCLKSNRPSGSKLFWKSNRNGPKHMPKQPKKALFSCFEFPVTQPFDWRFSVFHWVSYDKMSHPNVGQVDGCEMQKSHQEMKQCLLNGLCMSFVRVLYGSCMVFVGFYKVKPGVWLENRDFGKQPVKGPWGRGYLQGEGRSIPNRANGIHGISLPPIFHSSGWKRIARKRSNSTCFGVARAARSPRQANGLDLRFPEALGFGFPWKTRPATPPLDTPETSWDPVSKPGG